MKRKEVAYVYSQERLAPGVFSLLIETDMAKEAKAGQFIGVYVDDKSKILARPISICDVDRANDRIRMVYRVAGGGTELISNLKKGDPVQILGVLGNGYEEATKSIDFSDKKIIIIGGGIGIPPMLLASKTFKGNNEIVLGYANSNMFLKNEFDQLGKVTVATDDGSVGTKGTVIDAIRANGIKGDVIIACGPMPMLRAIKAYANENGMKAFISLEERMACGIGACLGCVCKTVEKDRHTHVNNTRICVEGPVFDAEAVDI